MYLANEDLTLPLVEFVLRVGGPGDEIPARQELGDQDVVERAAVHRHQPRDEGGVHEVAQHAGLGHHLGRLEDHVLGGHVLAPAGLLLSAVKRSIGFTAGFHNHGKGPY